MVRNKQSAKGKKRKAMDDSIETATSRQDILDNPHTDTDSRTNAVGRKRRALDADPVRSITLSDVAGKKLRAEVQREMDKHGLTILEAHDLLRQPGRTNRRAVNKVYQGMVAKSVMPVRHDPESDEANSVGEVEPVEPTSGSLYESSGQMSSSGLEAGGVHSSGMESGELDDDDSSVQEVTFAGRGSRDVHSSQRPEHKAALRLEDLNEEEQKLQTRYFPTTDPQALAICLSCGVEGHTDTACPANTCQHCRAEGEHSAGACPHHRKCTKCRQRGHAARTCTSRAVQGGGAGDPCDVCGQTGHVEEECSGLWRTIKFDPGRTSKPLAKAMRKACYNCGSSSHWGDDCPQLPAYIRTAGGKGTWSAENADMYAGLESGRSQQAYGGYSAGGGGYQHPQAYQLAQFDD
ncbi:hypothetical protein LTR53_003237 [Teratosphaeriaceae sp. CCFEE 6253]|nr:hypothetical protein LTR53_003237 [Teratosphaeriaceae sp. CCFEE 6253]